MSNYIAGLKGLLTENNPADSDMSTMLDCQDVVASQDNSIESRHGVNVDVLTAASGGWGTIFNVTNSNMSVFKVKFDTTTNSNNYKYVTLNGSTSVMTDMNTVKDLSTTLTLNTSVMPTTYTSKPLGFTFDQSLYIVTANGWQEMNKDLQSSSVGKKYIRFPGLVDINIDTFQDILEPSSNWLDVSKKVGLKFSIIWNTRYNNETPREVESEPSQIYEVLHPMALRTEVLGSTIANTLYTKSRIRVRIGSDLTDEVFPEFYRGVSNGRRFFIRVYRTRQVEIAEALPTDYYQAFPDVEFGPTGKLVFHSPEVNTGTEFINFQGLSDDWKNGDLVKYRAVSLAGGLTQGGLYYLGNKTGSSFQLFNTNMIGTTGAVDITSQGGANQMFIRIYQMNLTVNDDGILSLPQLYTNPNQDGDVNSNTIPPIAKSVVQYKNYHVAANIREPLRAYISLVKQPLVKNMVGKANIGAGVANGNYFFNTLTTTSPSTDLAGIPGNTFGIDSPFFRLYPPSNISVSGVNVTSTVNSDLPITVTSGPTTGSSDFFFDVNLVQKNASLIFRFDSGAIDISANVEPKYNRTSPYTRYTSLPGAFPYAGAIAYDKNLEWLQFAGPLIRTGFNTLPFYSTGTTAGRSYVDLFNSISGPPATPDIFKSNNRGNKKATIIGNGVYTLSGTTMTIATTDYNVSELPEPGIIACLVYQGPAYFTYKTVDPTSTASSLVFKNVSSDTNFLTAQSGTTFNYGYVMPGSNIDNTTLFFKDSPLTNNTKVSWVNLVSSALVIEAYPTALTGYYDKPIGIANSKVDSVAGIRAITNPLFLGNLAKSPAQLQDECVSSIVTSLNESASTSGYPIKFVKTDTVGEFYVEYYGGTKIEARITGDYHSYEPQIVQSDSTWTTLAQYNKDNIRAVSISRYNTPEVFPNSTVLAPILVGKDDKEIVALARNSNYCYILKEDGIWRLTVSGESSIPQVDQVVNLDTTTFCQATHSVQEINEEIIFLSQKGFISLTGNSVNPIGREIETEVKTKLQRAIASGLQGEIRSWVNEEKRIYGCTIRDTSATWTTFVFNSYTRQWTKFSLPVIDANTDDEGRTLYVISLPTATLGAGATLQEQLSGTSTGTSVRCYFTEEIHTQGVYRNEID